ncbi:MAG TPA: glycogen debranching enzyme N-terminal domain-containing protein, partial [Candidatus Kapabacteria bacterium]|nr:glycogen debranching enzyme N-terminal domain-containing protein [Candidatus Kapabacteria bacterium]
MSLIHFDKDRLQDMEFSLRREWLQANSVGAYSSSTLLNCNTRKYHGILVAAQPFIDDNSYVLLSSLDETVIYEDRAIPLGVHRYPNAYYPEGYKYLEEFSYENVPQWTMKAENVLLTKE